MALARGTSQSSEPTGQPLLHAISLRVQPKSEIILNAAVVPVVSHHARPRCVGLKSGFDRTTVRFVEEIRLSASVPTSTPFDFQYNKSGFSVSSATLLLLTQILVCCIDRLKPQHRPAIHQYTKTTRRRHSRQSHTTFCCSINVQPGHEKNRA